GWRTVIPSSLQTGGTRVSRPALCLGPKSRAPGNQGTGAMTSTSQRAARAANCCRLKGDESGSSMLGKILVSTSTRILDESAHASLVPRRRMHVLHVVSSLEIGGQERMILDLARGLKQRGHRVTVLSLAHG